MIKVNDHKDNSTKASLSDISSVRFTNDSMYVNKAMLVQKWPCHMFSGIGRTLSSNFYNFPQFNMSQFDLVELQSNIV
jgi:hypothetical protein